MLALLGCFFAHLSYSLRTARLASSFFMLDIWTSFAQMSVKQPYRLHGQEMQAFSVAAREFSGH